MSIETLPATVLQPTAHPDRSKRYAHVNSREVVAMLESEGYAVHSVAVTKTRRKQRDPLYAKHQVVLRHPDLPVIGGVTPQMIFVNSHDGTSSAEARQGLFRFVCSNGLVVGVDMARVRVRHSGDAATQVIRRVQEMSKTTQPLFQQIEKWSTIDLSKAKRTQFARLAAMLRWGDPHRFEPEALLAPRRAEDDKGTLWTVFNRVQENTVRGGLLGLSATGRAATSRPLSEITATNTFNAQLWQLATEFSELT